MLPALSVLLFSLVGFELAATTKKSTEEGLMAFLSPRIQSSSERVLIEKLRDLLEREDARNLRAFLVDADVVEDFEQNLEFLQSLELKLAENYERHYNRILHYLPDDLQGFFESYRILWDVENLKTVMCFTMDQSLPDRSTCPAGPFGFLDLESVESLTKHESPEKLLRDAADLLPTEFASELSLENRRAFHAHAFALDMAAFQYLKARSEEISTRRVRFAWSFLMGLYEVENLITIARLKSSGASPEQIEGFLFPSWRHLDSSRVDQLLHAEDYASFLLILRGTPYGEHLPKGRTDLAELEGFLKTGLGRFEFDEARRDITVEMVMRFLIELEEQFDIIRKSAFFVSIGNSGRMKQ